MTNKATLATLILLIISQTAVLAQQTTPGDGRQDPPWVKEDAPKKIVYAVPGMKQVKVRKNLTYKRIGTTELKADIYLLPGVRNRPAVILIHGGYLPPNLLTQPKDWGMYVSFGQLIAASGMIGITFNHRLYSNWSSLPDAQSDLADLISYIRENGESLGIDKDRIALWAFSGSGPLLSLAMRKPPSYIRCLVSYYAELDLQTASEDTRAQISEETRRDFSPLYHLAKMGGVIAPMFVARMGSDHPDINEAVDRFIPFAFAKNLAIELINYPGGHHGFDTDDDTDQSREIIKSTLAFIRANTMIH